MIIPLHPTELAVALAAKRLQQRRGNRRMTINMSVVDHQREAQRLTNGAYDHYADSMRADRPPSERAEAERACRLGTGLAFAHGLLAVADAVRHVADPVELDATLDTAVNAEPPANPKQSIAAHLERMAERYPAAVFTDDGHAPDAIAGTALRTVLITEAARLREEAS